MSPAPRPYTLVAELTYACPLHCVYCSNPVDFARHGDALVTDDWCRVLREVEQLQREYAERPAPELRQEVLEFLAEMVRRGLLQVAE